MSQPYKQTLPIRLALDRARNSTTHFEHRVDTVVCSLLQKYYPLTQGWMITPEQIQGNQKRPDFVIEKRVGCG
jgi:hypothetical protein